VEALRDLSGIRSNEVKTHHFILLLLKTHKFGQAPGRGERKGGRKEGREGGRRRTV